MPLYYQERVNTKIQQTRGESKNTNPQTAKKSWLKILVEHRRTKEDRKTLQEQKQETIPTLPADALKEKKTDRRKQTKNPPSPPAPDYPKRVERSTNT